MTSRRQATANRCNAIASTGPRTPCGKARSSRNALRHGLRSRSLVVPGLESPADWKAHHDAVLRDHSPQGYLEELHADRIAGLLWRLQRVTGYETGILEDLHDQFSVDHEAFISPELRARLEDEAEGSRMQHQAFRDLAASKGGLVSGDTFLWILHVVARVLDVDLESAALCGLPEESSEDQLSAKMWTTEQVGNRVADLVAFASDRHGSGLREDLRTLGGAFDAAVQLAAEEHRETSAALEEINATVSRVRRKRSLPGGAELEKIQRYEAHLERCLVRTLHELQRLQAARSGVAVPPPAVLDVTVSSDAS